MTERFQKMKAAGLIVVIFGAGLVAGMAILRLTLPPPHMPPPHGPGGPSVHAGPEHVLRSFGKRLDLSDEQLNEVRKVLKGSHEEVEEIFSKVQPELEASFKRAQERIRAVLDEERAKRFDEMIEEWEHTHKPRHHPPPPPIIPPPDPPGP